MISARHPAVILTFVVSILLAVMFTGAAAPAATASADYCVNCHPQTTRGCLKCHNRFYGDYWLDNQPSKGDVALANAMAWYLPLNLSWSEKFGPFYKISTAYKGSILSEPTSPSDSTDYVKCVGCHLGMKAAHEGEGSVPGSAVCVDCHNESGLPRLAIDLDAFMKTPHANSNGYPGVFFDQASKGRKPASTFIEPEESKLVGEQVLLYKADKKTTVNRNQRIAECSACHSYAMLHPTLTRLIGAGRIPQPQVGCPACHDAHIPAPGRTQPAAVGSTVAVSGSSPLPAPSGTVTAVVPAEGREVIYLNYRPFKTDGNGAAAPGTGRWDRGSDIAKPLTLALAGTGAIASGDGVIADRLSFAAGGFSGRVKQGDTLLISGEASAAAVLPAGAVNEGAPLSVRAVFDAAGFEVEEVLSDTELLIKPRTDSSALTPLGTTQIAAVAKSSVTYKKTDGKTGSLAVFVPFIGSFAFEVRDMRTNTEALCAACHTAGTLKFSAWGRRSNGSFVDVSRTHNNDVMGQYRNSGHGRGGKDEAFPAFDEFSAFPYASTHQTVYPFDMSIKGASAPPQAGNLLNKGNTTFYLTVDDPANAYLGVAGNTSLPTLINNYSCFQCHHGLGAVDFLTDLQGTADARVLWGDASVTCLTCHETHRDGAGEGVRVPVKLSYNTWFADPATNPRGGLNAFLDGTAIPSAAGTSTICLFCHQGRESGLTIYLNVLTSKGQNLYTIDPSLQIDPVSGVSFTNSHYMAGGAAFWSRNAWEYIFNYGTSPQSYSSGIQAHQLLNCSGCHMGEASADNTEGGHTWVARLETCRGCHGTSLTDFKQIPAIWNYDGGGATTTVEKLGTIADDGSTGSGLFWLLAQELDKNGIVYKPGSYPYVYDKATGGSYKKFTAPQFQAAFNLNWAFKQGTAVYYHNAFYVAQILQDSIIALGGTLPPAAQRPPGERPATDYRNITVNP